MKGFGEVIGDLEIWIRFEFLDENFFFWVVFVICNITVMIFVFFSLGLVREEVRV